MSRYTPNQMYAHLRKRGELAPDHLDSLCATPTDLSSAQWGAVLTAVQLSPGHVDVGGRLLKAAASLDPFLSDLAAALGPSWSGEGSSDTTRALDLLRSRAVGQESLDQEDWTWIINACRSGAVPVSALSSLLMTAVLRDLSPSETVDLTHALRSGGATIDHRPDFPGYSFGRRYPTGGVSEKIALLLPAFFGATNAGMRMKTPLIVAKALSFTGGTWDKLTSIPGFQGHDGPAARTAALSEVEGVIVLTAGQDLCPADDYLYQLRGATGTVASDGLIISSILAKHLSVASDALLLDVRAGEGAFLEDVPHAARVGRVIARLATQSGLPTRALLVSQNGPDGRSIGPALEVREAIDIIRGTATYPSALRQKELAIRQYAELLFMLGKVADLSMGADAARKSLASGAALSAFHAFLRVHGVDVRVADRLMAGNYSDLPSAPVQCPIHARRGGYLNGISGAALGDTVNWLLSGGRMGVDAAPNRACGLTLDVDCGQRLEQGEPWATIHAPGGISTDTLVQIQERLDAALEIGEATSPVQHFVVPLDC